MSTLINPALNATPDEAEAIAQVSEAFRIASAGLGRVMMMFSGEVGLDLQVVLEYQVGSPSPILMFSVKKPAERGAPEGVTVQ